MKKLATHFSVILFVPVSLFTAAAAFDALEAQATRARSRTSRPLTASEFPGGQAYFGPTWHLDPSPTALTGRSIPLSGAL